MLLGDVGRRVCFCIWLIIMAMMERDVFSVKKLKKKVKISADLFVCLTLVFVSLWNRNFDGVAWRGGVRRDGWSG